MGRGGAKFMDFDYIIDVIVANLENSMESIFINLGYTILGAILAIPVSRYFYKKSIETKISIYYIRYSKVFSGISNDILDKLNVNFEGRNIESLQEIIFVVVNDGENSITNIIRPLTLFIEKKYEIIDVSTINKIDKNFILETKIEKSEIGEEIHFDFPIMNKGDYFVIKMLVDGYVDKKDFVFKIHAENIPREINILPYRNGFNFETPQENSKNARSAFGVSFLFFCLSIWFGIIEMNIYEKIGIFIPHNFSTIPIFIYNIMILLPNLFFFVSFIFIFIGFVLAGFFGGTFPPRKRPPFRLPKDLAAYSDGFLSMK